MHFGNGGGQNSITLVIFHLWGGCVLLGHDLTLPLLVPSGPRSTVHSSMLPNGSNIFLTSASVCCFPSMPTNSFLSSKGKEVAEKEGRKHSVCGECERGEGEGRGGLKGELTQVRKKWGGIGEMSCHYTLLHEI